MLTKEKFKSEASLQMYLDDLELTNVSIAGFESFKSQLSWLDNI